MKNILAFAGSNSSTSINFELVKYTVTMIKGHAVELVNMNTLQFRIYDADTEKNVGFPVEVQDFMKKVKNADALIISVNEHNSNPSAYFKNLIDWLSRMDRKFLEGKKILLMGTSPGPRGAQGSLGVINALLPRFGGEVVATFSLPSFNDTFSREKGEIINPELKKAHQQALDIFLGGLD